MRSFIVLITEREFKQKYTSAVLRALIYSSCCIIVRVFRPIVLLTEVLHDVVYYNNIKVYYTREREPEPAECRVKQPFACNNELEHAFAN